MNKLLKKNAAGIVLLATGILFLAYGIHRQEHKTIADKSNIICLECIGIG